MDQETMASPGGGTAGDSSQGKSITENSTDFLKQMYSRSQELVSQEMTKDPVVAYRLYFGLSLLVIACALSFLRHGSFEAILSTLISSAITTALCWLVYYLTQILVELLEKALSKKNPEGSANRGRARSQDGPKRCYGMPISVLALLWAGVGCLAGVMLPPMSRAYYMSMLLIILCTSSMTFLIGIREPLCKLLPCETNTEQY